MNNVCYECFHEWNEAAVAFGHGLTFCPGKGCREKYPGHYAKVSQILALHGRWDIRPPSDKEKRWTVYAEYAPPASGCGETLLKALVDGVRYLKSLGLQLPEAP